MKTSKASIYEYSKITLGIISLTFFLSGHVWFYCPWPSSLWVPALQQCLGRLWSWTSNCLATPTISLPLLLLHIYVPRLVSQSLQWKPRLSKNWSVQAMYPYCLKFYLESSLEILGSFSAPGFYWPWNTSFTVISFNTLSLRSVAWKFHNVIVFKSWAVLHCVNLPCFIFCVLFLRQGFSV